MAGSASQRRISTILPPRVHRRAQRRRQAGGVEHRHHQQGHPLGRLGRVQLGRRLARPAGSSAPPRCRRRRCWRSCCGGCPARPSAGPWCPRCRGWWRRPPGPSGDVGQRQVRQARPSRSPAPITSSSRSVRGVRRPRPSMAAWRRPSPGRAACQELGDPVQPLVVDEGDLGPGIGQAVFQLGAGPPGVQRGDDRADQLRRPRTPPAIPAGCA